MNTNTNTADITSAVVTAIDTAIDEAQVTVVLDPAQAEADEKERRFLQNEKRKEQIQSLHNVILEHPEAAKVLQNEKEFEFKDLLHFKSRYSGGTDPKTQTVYPSLNEKISNAFPKTINGELKELEEMKSTRSGYLEGNDAKRYLFLKKMKCKNELMIMALDNAIEIRKANYRGNLVEDQFENAKKALGSSVTHQDTKSWKFARKASKDEAVEILGSEKALHEARQKCLRDRTKVLEIMAEDERLAFKMNGSAVQYCVERMC